MIVAIQPHSAPHRRRRGAIGDLDPSTVSLMKWGLFGFAAWWLWSAFKKAR